MLEPYNDMRMVMAAKPFTLHHDQKLKMAFAMVASEKGFHNGCPSYNLSNLKAASDEAQYAYCHPQTVGIAETATNCTDILVYPNPATSMILVKNLPRDVRKFNVIDVTGRIMPVDQHKNANDVDIDISNVPPGIYFLQIRTDGKLTVKRFLKK